jgi:putative oxidoreductase
MNVVIWIIQVLLAAAFLMSGIMKLTVSKNRVKEKVGGWVEDFKVMEIKMIGLVEILGAIGLILPMVMNIFPFLTPIAACGLGVTMIVAAQTHLKRKESIFINIIFLIMALMIVLGRLLLVPAA